MTRSVGQERLTWLSSLTGTPFRLMNKGKRVNNGYGGKEVCACNSFLLESRENPYCESYTGSKREKKVVRGECVYTCRKCQISEKKRVEGDWRDKEFVKPMLPEEKESGWKLLLKTVRQCTSFIGREPCRRRSRTMCRSEIRESTQLIY